MKFPDAAWQGEASSGSFDSSFSRIRSHELAQEDRGKHFYQNLDTTDLSIWPLLESSSTFKPCNEPDCSNRKRRSYSRVLLLNCKPNLTRSFSNTCTSSNSPVEAATGNPAINTKNISAIPTTFLFRPKNAESSLPNKARNANSLLQLKLGKPSGKAGFVVWRDGVTAWNHHKSETLFGRSSSRWLR